MGEDDESGDDTNFGGPSNSKIGLSFTNGKRKESTANSLRQQKEK